MKHNYFSYWILFFFSIFSFLKTESQPVVDSLLIQRNTRLNDYVEFKDGMAERTWIKLVNLNQKASELIETDNIIIDQYLRFEFIKNKQLKKSLEKANLELALMHKEFELQDTTLKEQAIINNTLLITSVMVGILFIIVLILFINRNSRYKAAYYELERFWAMKEDVQSGKNRESPDRFMQEKITELTAENESMKKKLNSISRLKLNAEKDLKAEISTRKTAEKEIRELIDQIKK